MLYDPTSQMAPLADFIRQGDFAAFHQWLGSHSDWPFLRYADTSALMLCLHYGQPLMAHSLLRLGADRRERDSHGNTLLMRAIQEGLNELINELTDSNSINAFNHEGMTALHYCIRMDNWSAALLLVQAGAELNQAIYRPQHDHHGMSPLMLAVTLHNKKIVDGLLNLGAQINQTDALGQHALILAARHQQIDLISLLCTRGAKIEHLDAQNKTALDYCVPGGATHNLGRVAQVMLNRAQVLSPKRIAPLDKLKSTLQRVMRSFVPDLSPMVPVPLKHNQAMLTQPSFTIKTQSSPLDEQLQRRLQGLNAHFRLERLPEPSLQTKAKQGASPLHHAYSPVKCAIDASKIATQDKPMYFEF